MHDEQARVTSLSGPSPDGSAHPTEVGPSQDGQPRSLPEPPLSEESALSVRAAALAVVCRGIRYLPVVDDGTLVGIVDLFTLGRSPRWGPMLDGPSEAATGSGRRPDAAIVPPSGRSRCAQPEIA
jgi:hypothetical protein